MVDLYKYLRLYVNNKLDWSDNTDALYKKGQSRLFLLRRLRSSDVCSRLLRMFYQSVVASAIFSAVACWGSGAGEGEKNRLNKLVEKASSVVGGDWSVWRRWPRGGSEPSCGPLWATPPTPSTVS